MGLWRFRTQIRRSVRGTSTDVKPAPAVVNGEYVVVEAMRPRRSNPVSHE